MVFIDCESSTRPISTNPGSMEAGEYGLRRGTCFVARRLEVVAVVGLLWMPWCVLGAAVIAQLVHRVSLPSRGEVGDGSGFHDGKINVEKIMHYYPGAGGM